MEVTSDSSKDSYASIRSVRELYIGIFEILMLTYRWHCHLRTTSRVLFPMQLVMCSWWGWEVVHMHIYDGLLSIIPAQLIKWPPSFIRQDEGYFFAVLVALPGMQVFCGTVTAWLLILENGKAQSLISVISFSSTMLSVAQLWGNHCLAFLFARNSQGFLYILFLH